MKRKVIVGCGAAVVALTATVVASGSGVLGPVRNGKITFFISGRGTGIEVINPSGSGRKVLASPGPCSYVPGYPCGIFDLAWSPDGRRLAFVEGGGGASDNGLYLLRADGKGEKNRLLRRGTLQRAYVIPHYVITWSPDGSTLVVGWGRGLYAVRPESLTVRRLTRDAQDGEPTWSPDGSRIAFTRGSLYTVRPDGSGMKRLPRTFGAYSPSWSPDGRSLVFAKAAGIYTVRADGSRLARVAVVPNWADNVAWSPDGTRILYASTPGKEGAFTGEVWVTRPDGSRPHRVYRQECCIDYSPTAVWSPDGKQIAISAAGGFYVVGRDGSDLRLLADGVIASGSAGMPELTWQPLR